MTMVALKVSVEEETLILEQEDWGDGPIKICIPLFQVPLVLDMIKVEMEEAE